MAKRILTPEQKEARKERARRRREARKAAAAAGTVVTKTPKSKKTPKPTETDPEVLKQITSAHTEDDIIAPKKAKKTRRSKKDVAADVQADTKNITLFSSLDSVKEHQFHRFSDNDDYKNVYYMVKTPTGSNLMRGLFCKITSDGKIDPSEYSKLEKVKAETGFIGFVKE